MDSLDIRSNSKNLYIDSDKKEFIWVSELKEPYVQGLAHGIAAKGTRIGMDQLEWLRYMSK